MVPAPSITDFPYTPEVESLFWRVRHLPGAVWLDSGKPRSLQGRFDIISACPQWTLTCEGETTRLSSHRGDLRISTEEPFIAARQLLTSQGLIDNRFANIPFVGGLIGYWNYDLGTALHGLTPERGEKTTTMQLGWYGFALILNHETRQARVVTHPAADNDLATRFKDALASPRPRQPDDFSLTTSFKADMDRQDYIAAVEAIQRYIRAGDCYQVNMSQAFVGTFQGDPWFAYRRLRHALPSPYGAFLSTPEGHVLSLSPERFLKVSVGQVETKPIKGTAPRGKTIEEDQKLAINLLNSPKNRAENLMIVDLLRNDLGKSCIAGSIKVPKLFALESFANVHHLVSTVTGTLADNKTALDLLRDCFPGGSITGAPKKRAMEIIMELERQPRGIYCGSIGYVSATGRMDTNIAIRTLRTRGNTIECRGGGGIVADSSPEDEYQECLDKVGILMRTLGKK